MDNKEVFVFTGGPPPNWLESHSWYAPVQVAPAEKMPLVGLKRLELRMAMCCLKCAEIISERLREVPGVMDVQVDQTLKKVMVIGAPFPADVLRRAKKVDRKAEWWPAPPSPPVVAVVLDKTKDSEEKKVDDVTVTTTTTTTTKTKKKKKKNDSDGDGGGDGGDGGGDGGGDDGGGGDKPKPDEPKLQQSAPPDYVLRRYPSYDYHPSQAYNPLLPYNPYPYSRQVFYDWPHFRTAEGAEAAFVPPPKPVPYQSVADLWNIFQPP